jgi:hypothetical protein
MFAPRVQIFRARPAHSTRNVAKPANLQHIITALRKIETAP